MQQDKLLTSTTLLKVRFHECDPLQIVWHGNYLKYFEVAREDFCREHGISYEDARENNIATPIVKSLCEHKLPLAYGEEFKVETTFVNSPAASMTFTYKIFKGDNVVCTGETKQVFLNNKRELILTNPEFFLTWKQKMGLL